MLACQGMSAEHDRPPAQKPPPIGHRSTHTVTVALTHVRRRVLMLTFLVAFVMYMDRTCIGVAAPTLMREFEIDKIQMSWAASAFNVAYTLFQVPAGRMADRYGPRWILDAAVAWWSVFTAATGLAYGFLSFSVTRFLFGWAKPPHSLLHRAPSCRGCPPGAARPHRELRLETGILCLGPYWHRTRSFLGRLLSEHSGTTSSGEQGRTHPLAICWRADGHCEAESNRPSARSRLGRLNGRVVGANPG